MRLPFRRFWLCILLAYMAISVRPASALVTSYTEDFTSKQYCDPGVTTAVWDTTCGETRLCAYVPTSVAMRATADVAFNVVVCGDHAFVGAYTAGLYIVDISNPCKPLSTAIYDTPDYANNVAVDGDYAYVADWNGDLQIVDISDPAHPAFAASCMVPGLSLDVSIAGNFAYVGIGANNGVRIVDISDPTSPALVGQCNTAGGLRYTVVCGDVAYVADIVGGLEAIDVSDPTNPTLLGICATPGVARGLAVNGDHAYVGDDLYGLEVVDISDPTNMVIVGNYDTPGQSRRVAVFGNYVYVADHASGLQVIDVTDPTSPVSAGWCDTPGHAHAVAVAGTYGYVADWTGGLRVIEIADSLLPPIHAGSCDTPGDARGIAVSGRYAFVGDGASGFQVVDFFNPTDPTLAAACDTRGETRGVAVWGNYAYACDGLSGLTVVDITQPLAPALAGSCDTPGEARQLAVAGDYIYVADGTAGLTVIDITDPTDPGVAGTCDTPGECMGVSVFGDYAYVCDGDSGVLTMDISSPASPVIASTYTAVGSAQAIVVSGDCAYVADGSGAFVVLDITDPANLVLAGTCAAPGEPDGVVVCGDLAFMGAGTAGLCAFDVTDPTNPVLVGEIDTPGAACQVAISGDYVFVADGGAGLQVIKVFERRFDNHRNVVQSVVFHQSEYTIERVRLTACQRGSIFWEVSADDGTNWDAISPGSTWHRLSHPGTELKWRSRYGRPCGCTSPACSSLAIGWLQEFSVIGSITDVPEDQGRQVTLSWTRSDHDFEDSPTPAVGYAIYRRTEASRGLTGAVNAPPLLSHPFQPSDGGAASLISYPPGDWSLVTTVPACCQEEYETTVPTLMDSTIVQGMHYTALFVRVITDSPDVYFDSPADSGYSVDNLAPMPPSGLSLHSPAMLVWNESGEEDFCYYTVYASDNPGLGDSAAFIGTTQDTTMDVSGVVLGYFHVTTTDSSGNEGGAATVANSCAGVVDDLPVSFALGQNRPNPFVGATAMEFDLPKPGFVSLRIYDVEGRFVSTIVDGWYPAGRHSVTWTGTDEHGAAAIGVYFACLTAGELTATKKLSLLR